MAKTHKQRGAILITVMAVMFVSMLIASVLVNHFAVAEARSVEQLLASVRADWAMRGHLNYALSRAWNESDTIPGDGDDIGLCDNLVSGETTCSDGDGTRITALTNLLIELGAVSRDWEYPNYTLTAKTTGVAEIVADADDGAVRIELELDDKDTGNGVNYFVSGGSNYVTTSGLAVPHLWVDICIVKTSGAISCEGSLANTDDTGYALIKQILRAAP